MARSSTVKEWRAATGHVPQHRAETSVPIPQGLSNACSISPLGEGQVQLAGSQSCRPGPGQLIFAQDFPLLLLRDLKKKFTAM